MKLTEEQVRGMLKKWCSLREESLCLDWLEMYEAIKAKDAELALLWKLIDVRDAEIALLRQEIAALRKVAEAALAWYDTPNEESENRLAAELGLLRLNGGYNPRLVQWAADGGGTTGVGVAFRSEPSIVPDASPLPCEALADMPEWSEKDPAWAALEKENAALRKTLRYIAGDLDPIEFAGAVDALDRGGGDMDSESEQLENAAKHNYRLFLLAMMRLPRMRLDVTEQELGSLIGGVSYTQERLPDGRIRLRLYRKGYVQTDPVFDSVRVREG